MRFTGESFLMDTQLQRLDLAFVAIATLQGSVPWSSIKSAIFTQITPVAIQLF